MPVKVGDLTERIAQGIRTSANEIFVLASKFEEENGLIGFSKQLNTNVVIERQTTLPFLLGREIKRYQLLYSGKIVIIPYESKDGIMSLTPLSEIKTKYPNTFAYLVKNKGYLENRERGRMRGKQWYGYIYPKNIEIMSQPKLLVPDIANRAQFAYDENGQYAFTSGYGLTFHKNLSMSPKYFDGFSK